MKLELSTPQADEQPPQHVFVDVVVEEDQAIRNLNGRLRQDIEALSKKWIESGGNVRHDGFRIAPITILQRCRVMECHGVIAGGSEFDVSRGKRVEAGRLKLNAESCRVIAMMCMLTDPRDRRLVGNASPPNAHHTAVSCKVMVVEGRLG